MKFRCSLFCTVLFLLPFCTLQAQQNVKLSRLGANLGLVDFAGYWGTSILLEGSADFGRLTKDIELDARLGLWKRKNLRDIILGSGIRYHFEPGTLPFQPFAGGGISLHFFNEKGSSDTEIGIDLRGGALIKYDEQINFMGELTFTLGDRAEQLSIKAGINFKLH